MLKADSFKRNEETLPTHQMIYLSVHHHHHSESPSEMRSDGREAWTLESHWGNVTTAKACLKVFTIVTGQ